VSWIGLHEGDDDSFYADLAAEWEDRDRQRDEDERAIADHFRDLEDS
jgi:hypothetical protein